MNFSDADTIAIELINLMEAARLRIDQLRTEAAVHGFDVRALSIAMTELETAQLWVANARPE